MHVQLQHLQEKLANLSSIGAQDLADGALVYFGMSRAAEGKDDRFKRLLVVAPSSIN
jgi:hypothetical protein